MLDNMNNKPLYEYRYAKDEKIGFNHEQDLKILYALYPNARMIQITYSVPGEVHFVITNG